MENIKENQVLEENLSYQVIKNIIKGKLNSVAESFVSIGYRLKQVRDRELYKQDGYKDIYEFALKEYNLCESNASRFMSINDKFSENGNSLFLISEYAGYGSSKLSEMLNLDDEEIRLVSGKTTVKEIREIKQVKKEAAQMGVVATSQRTTVNIDFTQSKPDFSSLKNIVIKFFRDKRNLLEELIWLLQKSPNHEQLNEEVSGVINPSKHLSLKDGLTMAFLEENIIKYKEFGKQTIEYTYADFTEAVKETFNLESDNPWKEYYGEPEEKITTNKEQDPKENETITPPKQQEQPEDKKNLTEKPINTQEETKENDNIKGQINIKNYPEYAPDEKEIEKVTGEIIHAPIKKTSQPESIHNTKNIDNCECIYCYHKWDGGEATNYDTTASIIKCPECGKEMGVMQSVEYECFEIK